MQIAKKCDNNLECIIPKIREELGDQYKDLKIDEECLKKGVKKMIVDLKGKLSEKAEDAKEMVKDKLEDSSDTLGDIKDKVFEKVEVLKDKAGDIKDSITEVASDLKEKVAESVSDFSEDFKLSS
jgi:predicted  nucleic acid-binding Zn-ribbon protein